MIEQVPDPYGDETPKSASRPNRLPPIRIIDLMVLTACIAFFFMFQEQYRRAGAPLGPDHWFSYVNEFFYAFLIGTSLAGWFWIIRQKRLTGKFFHEPGHWLVGSQMLIVFAIIPAMIIRLIYGSIDFDGGDWQTLIYFWSDGFFSFMVFVLLIFGFCLTLQKRWKLVLAVASAESLASGINDLMFYALISNDSGSFSVNRFFDFLLVASEISSFVLLISLAVFTLIAVLMDFIKKIKRDWLHWVGVCLILATSIIAPIFQAIFMKIYLLQQTNQ